MKIKNGYLLREIAGKWMVIPVGRRAQELHGMIALNETGAFIWKALENEQTVDTLLESILNEYDVTEEVARDSVSVFIQDMRKEGVIDE